MSLTEKEIQLQLARYKFGIKNICVPNIYLYLEDGGAYEADFIYITSNDYISEIEIKIDINDFKNDFKKKIYHIHKSVRNFYYAFSSEFYDKYKHEIKIQLMDINSLFTGIIIVNKSETQIVKKAIPRIKAVPLSEQEKIKIMRIGCMKWYR